MLFFNSLSSDRSMVKITKRSKACFGHNTLSFCPIHMKPLPKYSLFNSLSSDRSKSRSQKGQKHVLVITRSVFVWFIWNQLQKVHFSNSLSSDRSKVKVKVAKRSKTYFGYNTLSFCPSHMKPTPNCSFFNSLSSDMVTNVALAKVCTLPNARSS